MTPFGKFVFTAGTRAFRGATGAAKVAAVILATAIHAASHEYPALGQIKLPAWALVALFFAYGFTREAWRMLQEQESRREDLEEQMRARLQIRSGMAPPFYEVREKEGTSEIVSSGTAAPTRARQLHRIGVRNTSARTIANIELRLTVTGPSGGTAYIRLRPSDMPGSTPLDIAPQQELFFDLVKVLGRGLGGFKHSGIFVPSRENEKGYALELGDQAFVVEAFGRDCPPASVGLFFSVNDAGYSLIEPHDGARQLVAYAIPQSVFVVSTLSTTSQQIAVSALPSFNTREHLRSRTERPLR